MAVEHPSRGASHPAHSQAAGRRGPRARRARACRHHRHIYATVLDYAGAEAPPPAESRARSLRGLLAGTSAEWDDVAFMEQEETRAIRTRKWLLMRRFAPTDYGFSDELYDLEADPDERNNLIDDPACAAVVAELSERIDSFFSSYANPKWDLWRGGTVKSNSTRPFLWEEAWGEDWAPTY